MYLAAQGTYVTPLSNSTLLPLLLLSLARGKDSSNGIFKINQEYDYIIVGGSIEGSILANRLSEAPCVRVLLLKTGSKPPLQTRMSAMAIPLSHIDWQFRTVPKKYYGTRNTNRKIPRRKGKIRRGHNSMNDTMPTQIYQQTFDDWASQGAKGWNYGNMLPYFMKHKEYLGNGYNEADCSQTGHKSRHRPQINPLIRETLNENGYTFFDLNSAEETGFHDLQVNMGDRQGCSVSEAYLEPAEKRLNLHILRNVVVKMVIIEDERAIGVEFDFGGGSFQVNAKKEIILSSGPVETPHLLMLSGVGPRDMLEKQNISVKVDLPVGKNLQDHGAILVSFELNPDLLSKDENRKFESSAEYVDDSKNEASSSSKVQTPIVYDNYELLLGEISATEIMRESHHLKPEVYQALFGPYESKPLLLCLIRQMQPRSKGTISLRSSNVYDSPMVDPKYLADARDEDDFVDGMKACQNIAASKALKKIGAKPLHSAVPGCEKFIKDEESYFRCQLKFILMSTNFAAGTAKMGNIKDITTVVDDELRVINIDGLRVVDASVMPKLPPGNSNIPIIMIAERASDLIKETIGCKTEHHHVTENWNDRSESSHVQNVPTLYPVRNEWTVPVLQNTNANPPTRNAANEWNIHELQNTNPNQPPRNTANEWNIPELQKRNPNQPRRNTAIKWNEPYKIYS